MSYKMEYIDIATGASLVDQWTDPVTIKDEGVVSIENTNFIGTVTLQFKSNSSGTWYDMDTIAVIATTYGRYEFHGYGDDHRVGVAAGDYTSGSGRLAIQG